MKNQTKIIAIIITVIILISAWIFVFTQPKKIVPPEIQHLKIDIDFYNPAEGNITVTSPLPDADDNIENNMIKKNLKYANSILGNQYYIPYPYKYEIPTKKEQGQFTSTYKFFALDEFKHIWGISTFNSTGLLLYKQADIKIILPVGYNISEINTNTPYQPTKIQKDNRWNIGIKTLENQYLKIGITYFKES